MSSELTPVEAARQIRDAVHSDVISGLPFDLAVECIATFLGIRATEVRLAIVFANEADAHPDLAAWADQPKVVKGSRLPSPRSHARP